MDLNKFYKGEAFDAYEYFGAHVEKGRVVFRVYAPRAEKLCIMGEFTGWQEHEMQTLAGGVWEYSCPWAYPGQMYKYVVYGANGRVEHCDPYGYGMEMRPGNCSVIRELHEFKFTDRSWMRKRTKCFDRPLNIYEMHLGSWRKKGWQWYLYDEIADQLIAYLEEQGYTHVEFMPLTEHPFDGSWGYQNVGYFAPTFRYGTAAQLMALIDRLHNAGIGAILDFVPVHFAMDWFGLRDFDGTALYEYSNKRMANSEWGSRNFDHGSGVVCSFLQSAANYWLKEYHFDGLRMDAVSRLIFRKGDWRQGENPEGMNFLKGMNHGLQQLHPTAMLIAEDSTAWGGVTRPVEQGGLSFDYKWDLGWTYNTLKYFGNAPATRAKHAERVSTALEYSRNERYILPLSHDETARGTGTILQRIHGEYEDKLRQARLLYLYMLCHPGKKLNFMGNELAVVREWNEDKPLDWDLQWNEKHGAFLRFVADANHMYLKRNALWANDHGGDNFQWLDCRCPKPCVFGISRPMGKDTVLAFFNFSDKAVIIEPDIYGRVAMLINSDWDIYGGNTKKAARQRIMKRLPAYSAAVYICRE